MRNNISLLSPSLALPGWMAFLFFDRPELEWTESKCRALCLCSGELATHRMVCGIDVVCVVCRAHLCSMKQRELHDRAECVQHNSKSKLPNDDRAGSMHTHMHRNTTRHPYRGFSSRQKVGLHVCVWFTFESEHVLI